MTAEKQRLTEGLSLFTVVLSIPGALVWMRTKTVRVAGCCGFVIANGIRLTCVCWGLKAWGGPGQQTVMVVDQKKLRCLSTHYQGTNNLLLDIDIIVL